MKKNRNDEIDLLRLVKALWHRAWAVILAAVMFGACAFGCTCCFVTPLYKAETLLYVNNSAVSVDSSRVSISAADLSAAQSLVDTYTVILKSRTTLNDVIGKLDLDYTYEELSDMISSGAVNSTEVFRIEVTSPDPKEAAAIANIIASILPEKISSVVEGSSVRIVDYAVTPAEKDSPNIARNTALGILLGIVLSCGIIVLLELLDEQIHDEEDLLQNYDLPVLAVIPDLLSPSKQPGGYHANACQAAGAEGRKNRG